MESDAEINEIKTTTTTAVTNLEDDSTQKNVESLKSISNIEVKSNFSEDEFSGDDYLVFLKINYKIINLTDFKNKFMNKI